MVDQHPSHQLGRDGEELRAVLPVGVLLIHELEVGLVDERRGLQRVLGPLSPEMRVRDPVQFLVDERHQVIEGIAIALVPGEQEGGYVGRHGGPAAGERNVAKHTRKTWSRAVLGPLSAYVSRE